MKIVGEHKVWRYIDHLKMDRISQDEATVVETFKKISEFKSEKGYIRILIPG